MVNDLQELMRQNVAAPPPELVDLDGLVAAGRQRARRRHRGRLAAGGAVVLTAGVVAAGAALWPSASTGPEPAGRPPAAHGPTISLTDATRAVEGQDYRVLAHHTNANLDADNGQYFDGVTDDGQILFQDGPRGPYWNQRLALMDPATGEKDWLPDPDLGQEQFWPVELGAENLVLQSVEPDDTDGLQGTLSVRVFDRATEQWSTLQWPGLPQVRGPKNGQVGPDGRLYVLTPATTPGPPPGGWPTAPDGDAEDADADGETSHLWSVSLTDTSDVRDEQQVVGDFAFTDDAMVWTDGSNGDPGRVHVRDLASGEEHSFDPHTGERCNLLSLGASQDRIVMSQYCGTYDDEVRDDRVQVLSTSGEPVVTLQDSGIDGWVTGGAVVVSSFRGAMAGTYVYQLDQDRLLRVSDSVSNFGMGGPTPDGLFLWHTPFNHRHGAEQWLGQLLD